MTGITGWKHDAQCAAERHVPFPPGSPRWADDYLHEVLFKTDEEYDFFAAVAGVQSRFDKPALIQPRRIPPHLSMSAAYNFRHEAELAGWLTLPEIDRCIQHVSDGTSPIRFDFEVALGLMRSLIDRLTDPHVRLVFDIEGA